MAISYYKIEDNFNIDENNKDVKLEVLIGDGHDGAFIISADDKICTVNKPAQFSNLEDLKNKWINVVVSVLDTMNETNWTSVTLKFENNKISKSFGPFKKEVDNNHDTIIFIIRIKIV